RMGQRDREQLVWSDRVIVTVLAIHHIEQSAAALIPETCIERFANAVGAAPIVFLTFLFTTLGRPFFHHAQCVVPESVDLDGFAAPRCDDQIADLRVHPRQLVSRRTLHKQAVRGIDPDAETSATLVQVDDLLEQWKQSLECVVVSARFYVALRGMKEP